MPKDMVDGYIDVGSIARIDEATHERLSQHSLEQGDIVLARRGDVGRRVLVRSDEVGWLCGTGSMRVSIPHDTMNPKFLYYYLGTERAVGFLRGRAVGATMPNLNADIVRSLPVPSPPLDTQRKIAAVLSAYDDLIANNLRRIETLEEMARVIYREWFVEFRFPGHEGMGMVESELGLIPEGWELWSFSEIAKFINGFAFKPDHWGEVGRPIIKIKELKNGVTSQTPRYDGEDLPDKFNIKNGDILFSWSGHLDAYLWAGGDALLNQHLFNVIPVDRIDRMWLFHTLKNAMPHFRARALGTTMHHIKRSALVEVRAVHAPEAACAEFASHVHPIHQLARSLVEQVDRLRQTRDLLLPKLVSGEIDLSDLDIDVGDMAA